MSRTIKIAALAMAILAFFLFVGSPFQQAASAVAIEGSLIAIIIAALSAMGITFVVNSAYGSLEEYVGDLLNEYSSQMGFTTESLFSGVQSGSNNVGQLLLNNRFVVLISSFATWLVSKLGLTNNSTKTLVQPGAQLGEIVVYQTPFVLTYNNNNHKEYIVINGSAPVYVALGLETNNFHVVLLSEESATVNVALYMPNGTINGQYNLTLYKTWPQNGVVTSNRYYLNQDGMVPSAVNQSSLQVYDYSYLKQILAGDQSVDTGDVQIDVVTSVINPALDDEDYTPGDGAILDVGASWGLDYDDITDVVIPGDYAGGNEADADITYTGEGEVAEQVESTAENTVSKNPDSYTSPGLQSVFPFCIPFDIYAFFECLAADPVAPAFTWRFYVPGICDEEITVDLAPFNTVAQVVRTMELLAFIVGLALVTRDKFLRG